MAGSIHKQVLELAKKIGAPAVGSNVQETMKSINAYLDGTTHGANISDTVDEFKKVYSGGGGGEVKLEEKTADPSTSQQVITASAGYDGLKKVTISAVTSDIDSNITAENIKEGVEILGVEGKYSTNALYFDTEFNAMENYYIDDNTGEAVPYDSWIASDYQGIPENSDGNLYYIDSTSDASSNKYNAFYDSNKEFIKSFTAGTIISIPNNARYFRTSSRSSSYIRRKYFTILN